MKTYVVNEIFCAPQGEGVRAGTVNLFVRFAGCNLTCRKESHGFDCDTQFSSGVPLTAREIVNELSEIAPRVRSVILTGGEPLLQVDEALVFFLKESGYFLALETNGTLKAPDRIDWVTVSPKVAEHAIRQLEAQEVKYVLHAGQPLPKSRVSAQYYVVSPAWDVDPKVTRANLDWCIKLCKESPAWRVSLQLHKIWASR